MTNTETLMNQIVKTFGNSISADNLQDFQDILKIYFMDKMKMTIDMQKGKLSDINQVISFEYAYLAGMLDLISMIQSSVVHKNNLTES